MKSFHQNVLILLASGLCCLCAYQWWAQATQRTDLEKLEQAVAERNAGLRAATNALATADHHIAQLDACLTVYKCGAQTNDLLIAAQKNALLKLQAANALQAAQLAADQQRVAGLDAKLKEAYYGIKIQNTNNQVLVEQRDALVAKYNAAIQDRNEVVAQYNRLVRQLEKQAAAVPTATRAAGGSGP